MDTILADPLFQALFNSPVPRIIVEANAPAFTIVTNNNAHAIATNLVGKNIRGKSVWEIFDPAEAGGDGGDLLLNALQEAQKSNKTVLMPPFRYDMLALGEEGMEEKWWQLEIMPVGGDKNKPRFLLTTTHEITTQVLKEREIENGRIRERELFEQLALQNEELVKSRADLQQLYYKLEEYVNERTEELAASEAKFRAVIEQAPVAITLLEGEDLMVEAANSEILRIWGKGEEVVGLPIIYALPEMEGQPYPEILRDVFKSGVPFYGNEQEVQLFRNGQMETGYFNFINYPFKDKNGSTQAIIVVASEVTELVQARKRLHSLIMNAHYPLMILQGREYLVEVANQEIANLWDKPLSKIIGRELLDILPEIKDQPFPALLNKVFDTGTTYSQEEELFYLNTPEGRVLKYVSFFYDPVFDENNKVTAIIVSANDITANVVARRELESAYAQLRLSKNAAELGTFDMDLVKGTMEWDFRCRELFGISHTSEVSYEKDFLAGLHPDDKDMIRTLISDLLNKRINDGNYDAEYRTIGFEDQKIRWVRAKGKVFFDHHNTPIRLIGSVLEITDKKQDEQRKSDFIAMVSHELKTPLTSLKANIQLLSRQAEQIQNTFFSKSLSNSEKQINKMSELISGFLNLSRLESGKLSLELQDIELNDLIYQEMEEWNTNYSTRRIFFKRTKPICCKADANKIGMVITNLLSNAIKYSPDQTAISIELKTNNGFAIISIQDKGIGIAESELQKLFNRYFRSARADTKYISGFGIGLYLCYEIVQLHEGKIWAESELGKGSTFFFSLPLGQV
ncbi:PAS domain-containing sensor histidine kinase [Desertivirga brevis]|uniref:PAS domain-containing sensor histidine kinase n=1 Tax=Desertivirga brevis TaxID=2810310 RepID=UPI001A97C5DD|nr:PAS domain-containing sensor histidine kinase [Pedobacter sp. SYSU D00873]